MKNKRDWTKWCRAIHMIFVTLHPFWTHLDDEWKMIITRLYYHMVQDCGNPNPSGYISEKAYLNKINGRKTVEDHCFSPQFIGRMIMDNWHVYQDYEKFEKVFFYSTQTIIVTQKENDDLSDFTQHDADGIRILVSTDQKYHKLGIELYKRYGVKSWKDASPTYQDSFPVPEELLEYEKGYLVS